jgi:hypothetical protein
VCLIPAAACFTTSDGSLVAAPSVLHVSLFSALPEFLEQHFASSIFPKELLSQFSGPSVVCGVAIFLLNQSNIVL